MKFYGWELVAFGTEAASINKTFGHGVKITSAEASNNLERVYGLGSRNATATVAKAFNGSFNVEFPLCSGYFWRFVTGDEPADAGGGPYTHTYVESNSLQSITIEDGMDLSTDSVRKYLGVTLNSMTLECRQGEIAKVTLDCSYADESEGTTLGSQVAEVEEPLPFQYGSIEIPNGSALTRVQSVRFTYNPNAEIITGLGSRFGTAAVGKARNYDFTIEMTYEDAVQLERFYGGATGPIEAGPATTATLELTFSNGAAGDALRSQVLLFTDFYIDKISVPKDADSVTMQTITGWCHALTSVIFTNNTDISL